MKFALLVLTLAIFVFGWKEYYVLFPVLSPPIIHSAPQYYAILSSDGTVLNASSSLGGVMGTLCQRPGEKISLTNNNMCQIISDKGNYILGQEMDNYFAHAHITNF